MPDAALATLEFVPGDDSIGRAASVSGALACEPTQEACEERSRHVAATATRQGMTADPDQFSTAIATYNAGVLAAYNLRRYRIVQWLNHVDTPEVSHDDASPTACTHAPIMDTSIWLDTEHAPSGSHSGLPSPTQWGTVLGLRAHAWHPLAVQEHDSAAVTVVFDV